MKTRHFACVFLAFGLTAMSLHFRAQEPPADPYLTAHEWGRLRPSPANEAEPWNGCR